MYSQGPGMGWGSSRISNTGPEKAQPQLPAGPSFSPPNVRFLLSPDPHGYVGSRPQGRKKNHSGKPRGRIVGFGHNTTAGTEQPGSSRPRSPCRALPPRCASASGRTRAGACPDSGTDGRDRATRGSIPQPGPARASPGKERSGEPGEVGTRGTHVGLRDLRPRSARLGSSRGQSCGASAPFEDGRSRARLDPRKGHSGRA
ncbi:hypothetical protein mRhiFer1_009160 [Rhinolophus ferrumequinum]|uniref:Uncharacterized protein n=1 Tax=Rhinolophus ferrumequinum TaxID=59479 RepID=A0A7J7SJ23_RHIFE|nr:uncharacterized protein LOC117034308 [Rhinolophus ferrumequinum]KAF6288442.1 hypothetical protein mRhiFer1_009160 [Rhinolophus ferrumequinum]